MRYDGVKPFVFLPVSFFNGWLYNRRRFRKAKQKLLALIAGNNTLYYAVKLKSHQFLIQADLNINHGIYPCRQNPPLVSWFAVHKNTRTHSLSLHLICKTDKCKHFMMGRLKDYYSLTPNLLTPTRTGLRNSREIDWSSDKFIFCLCLWVLVVQNPYTDLWTVH